MLGISRPPGEYRIQWDLLPLPFLHYGDQLFVHRLLKPETATRAKSMIVVLALSVSPAGANEPIDYLEQVKPILAEKCYSCHGSLKQESGLRLETRALMIEGGVIDPGRPDESQLLDRVVSNDPDERMPPPHEGSPLKAAEVAVIRDWIAQGAAAPDEPTPSGPGDHWAFQVIQRPEIPASSRGNPIDAFLDAKLAERSLVAQPPAPRTIAIRRLYMDLVGIPPTPTQLLDQRPWSEIVDELLASPQHAERWARHWMDVWRYSDWYGLGAQLRYSQKHLWHWRDWIIDSLHKDKGYDRMVMEMLAGDELAPTDFDAVRGTGYLARNYYLFNRTTWLDSTIEHTGKAFLGLTLNCAKCHDHKYDPITQLDYYRFRALFEPHQVRLDPVPGETDLEKDGLPRVFDDHIDAQTFLHIRGNPKEPDQETSIVPGVPAILASFAPEIQPIPLPSAAFAPGTRDYVQQDRLASARNQIVEAQRQLDGAQQKLAESPPAKPAGTNSESSGPQRQWSDDFDGPRPELWEMVGDGWQYRDGALHQTTPTRDSAFLRLLKPVPRDFELLCTYTTTGGTTYKSVTFRFDQTEDGKYSNYVYTSAHAPGPKVQVAYSRGGTNSYPADGRVGKKIEIGRKYRLRFAVRGELVNVWLDDQFILTYRYPDRRPEGYLSLSAFDATAAFDSITVRTLGKDVALTEAKNRAPLSQTNPAEAVSLARAKLEVAKANVASLEATIAADNAAYRDDVTESDRLQLARKAARMQIMHEIKSARHELLSVSDDTKGSAIRKRIKQAEKRLGGIDREDPKYDTLRVSRKALETPAHKESDYPPTYSPTSTGRRLALAKWITARENPLTARVAVNQVWMRHFGRPLVDSVFDFGLRAPQPAHHQLLDLLSYEFMESGWSFRHLHRMIVTSDAYRRSSTSRGADQKTVRADPENQYYWRMNWRRMEAQVVRDSLLHLAGELDLQIGGPSIDPKQGGTRRSLYFKHSRDQQDKFLAMFDDADLLQCYRRSESIVPQQALALSNSKLSLEMSEKIAARIAATLSHADDEEFVSAVFLSLLGRSPSDAERSECRAFVSDLSELLTDQEADKRQQRVQSRLVHAILNHNDFISIR